MSLWKSPVIAGKSIFDSFAELPAVRREVDAVESIFKRHNVFGYHTYDSLVGPTISQISNDLCNASLIHIASHSSKNGAIVLADIDGRDAHFSAADVYKACLAAGKLQPYLVILNCCYDQAAGPNICHLSRALMSCGVPCVIHTIGAVRDDAATSLLTCFYETMLQEDLSRNSTETVVDCSNSLRIAMLKIMSEQTDKYQPRDWLVYVASGIAIGQQGSV
jgi:CHAT domain-containing protein